jgi:flagellar protein FlgJ
MASLAIGALKTTAPTSSARLAQALATAGAQAAKGPLSEEVRNKARTNAVDFEATFLNAMFSQMFTGIDGDGPFGGGGTGGMWRSFLSDEYAKTFAKAGGIGLADHVYRALIAQQEARAA